MILKQVTCEYNPDHYNYYVLRLHLLPMAEMNKENKKTARKGKRKNARGGSPQFVSSRQQLEQYLNLAFTFFNAANPDQAEREAMRRTHLGKSMRATTWRKGKEEWVLFPQFPFNGEWSGGSS